MLVGVADYESDRGAGGDSAEHPREDFNAIGFVAGRDYRLLTGPSARELTLHLVKRDFNSGRHAVDNSAQSGTVGFAESGQAKDISYAIVHRPVVLQLSHTPARVRP